MARCWRITAVKPKNKRAERFVVRLDPQRDPLELDAELVTSERVIEGLELSEERIGELLRADERIRCRQRAWSLLARRMRSRAELRRALRQRKFTATIVDETLDRIESMGHLDDAAFARMFAENRASAGRSGPRLIRSELRQRGVTDELAEAALAESGAAELQPEQARRLLTRWNRRPKPTEPHKRKAAAAAYLMRRGFDADVVWSAVREVLGEDEQHLGDS